MDIGRENERLFAQVAFLSGDDHVRREAAPWKEATPSDRLQALVSLCRQAARFLDNLAPEARQRATEPDALPAGSIALLAKLRSQSR